MKSAEDIKKLVAHAFELPMESLELSDTLVIDDLPQTLGAREVAIFLSWRVTHAPAEEIAATFRCTVQEVIWLLQNFSELSLSAK